MTMSMSCQLLGEGGGQMSDSTSGYIQYTPPTRVARLNCRVASRRRRQCEHEFATSSRRLPTDSVDNLETDCWDSVAVWLREFWSISITFSTMASISRHLSLTSIKNSTENCKLGHDCRRVRSHRRRDSTRVDSWIPSASAVYIGL